MDCACVYIGDYDGPEFYDSRIQTARKYHECSECRADIAPGTRYKYFVGLWDGEISVFKLCLNCTSIEETIFCDGIMHGNMYEDLDQHIDYCNGEISSESILKLTPIARNYVLEKIDQIWEAQGLWEEDE